MTLTQKTYTGIGTNGWIAGGYSAPARADLSEFQTLAGRVVEDLPYGSRVLEVASGAGLLAVELAKAGYNQITALDDSRASVESARRYVDREGVAVRVRQGDYSAMPFPDERFERVVCRTAIHNFLQPLGVLKEIHRVLKPGGSALIVDVPEDSSFLSQLAFRTLLRHRVCSTERFQQLALESGFAKCTLVEKETGFEAWVEKEPESERN
ncbi:MAG TPA: class I SAM-dependent methyltransferase [Bryobacteraceae bacterium]|jgi:ubiquinone/menaquinone biosynthesis C-methylase UbiE